MSFHRSRWRMDLVGLTARRRRSGWLEQLTSILTLMPFRGGFAGVFWVIVLLQHPRSLQLELTNRWPDILLQDFLVDSRIHGSIYHSKPEAAKQPQTITLPPPYFTVVDLEQYEVEDSIMGMMNDEFDTIVEDGSHSLVAQQLCLLYSQCWQGDTAAVQEKITQLAQKKYDVKAKVQEVTPSDDDDDEESSDDKEEAMDCENTPSSSYAASASGTLGPSPAPKKEEEAEDDGWTVVCRKKK
uniref:Pre-rRNA-processing protein TSR2 homolog n=1 Tax=Xenopus tropicalis TaxID=8364 RepID=A0A803K1T5_XENTR